MPKLSIIIGAKDAQEFIEECLDSIQNQTAFNCDNPFDYEILLGIDGCLNSLKQVLLIKDKYKKLNVFWMPKNEGVYITFNTLLQHATGSHVVFFGADDVMFPDMVENMYKLGAPLVIRHHGIQFLERDIFKLTGGFMPWRISADTEHLGRVSRILNKIIPSTEYMYTYRSHPGQLTKRPETALNSALRANYVQLIQSGVIPTTINPIIHEEYMDIDSKAFADYQFPDEIHVGIASFPAREKSLSETINSLYDQVDYLHIYLNNYESVPEFLNKPKITTYFSTDNLGDLGDVGKFFGFFADKVSNPAYLLTADDDIVYHKNYVKLIINGINKYEKKAIVSLHGRIFNNYPVISYYRDNAMFYPCLRKNNADVRVHFAGTGVMGWHNSTLTLVADDFTHSNMADIFVSALAHKLKIPLIVIEHAANIVADSKSYDRKHSICHVSAHDDSIQTNLVNKAYPNIKKLFDTKKNPYNVNSKSKSNNHVITTRLFYDDKILLADRIKLTKEILLPCLKAQSCKDFTLAIRCYNEDLELLKSEIDFPFINFESYEDYVKICKDKDFKIQTRHDSDDYMSPDYIEFIQYEVNSKKSKHDKFLLQFQPIKLDYKTGRILPLPDYTNTCNSGFLTIFQTDIVHSIYERSHTEMFVVAPDIYTYPRGFVKYYIHGKNDSLLPREVRLKQNKF